MIKSKIKKLANKYGYDIIRIPSEKDKEIVDAVIEDYKEDNRFALYKDKHKGERCVIIGNGPSLKNTDLRLLENEITFGQNKVFLFFPFITWTPTYVVSYVPDVIRQRWAALKNLQMPLFVSMEGRTLLGDRQYETHHFGPLKRFLFSLNPHQEICVGHTVTYVTMQLAFYMGFKQVLLIGVDHNFGYSGPSDTWHLIDKPSNSRHFVDNYFAPGQTWQSPNLKMAEAHYTFAKSAYEHFGREIIDCTVNGKLQVFTKVSLEDALK